MQMHIKKIVIVVALTLVNAAQAFDAPDTLNDLAQNIKSNIISRFSNYVRTPSIINPEVLTEEERAEVQQVYQDYRDRRFNRDKSKALRCGLSAGLVSIPFLGIVIRDGFKHFTVEGLIFDAPSVICSGAIGIPLAAYSLYQAARLMTSYNKRNNARTLEDLNKDLYKQLGSPETESYRGNVWGAEMLSVCEKVDLTKKESMERALYGNYSCETMYVPESHA